MHLKHSSTETTAYHRRAGGGQYRGWRLGQQTATYRRQIGAMTYPNWETPDFEWHRTNEYLLNRTIIIQFLYSMADYFVPCDRPMLLLHLKELFELRTLNNKTIVLGGCTALLFVSNQQYSTTLFVSIAVSGIKICDPSAGSRSTRRNPKRITSLLNVQKIYYFLTNQWLIYELKPKYLYRAVLWRYRQTIFSGTAQKWAVILELIWAWRFHCIIVTAIIWQ